MFLARRDTIFLLMTLVSVDPLPAQQDIDESQANRGLSHIARLGDELQALGNWQEFYPMVERTVDRFWTENDLTDEADLFARDLVKEVALIPPWEFARRLEVLSDSVSARYGFTDQQKRMFQSRFLYHMGKTTFKNAGVIFKQTREMISARSNGQPYTPEQVAEWTRESEPMMADFRKEFESLAASVERTLTPAQKKIFERDMRGYRRRQEAFEQIRKSWAEGGWTPEHWGMDEDPIQMQRLSDQELAELVRNKKRAIAVRRASVPVLDIDETTWERYVRQFIQRFKLDDAQANAALSILRELEQRASGFKRTHAELYREIPRAARRIAPQFKPLRDMFDELKQQLDRIPTEAQRQNANKAASPGS